MARNPYSFSRRRNACETSHAPLAIRSILAMGISNGRWLARLLATARSPRRAANGTPGRILLLVLAMMVASLSWVLVVQAPPPLPMTTQGTAFDRFGSPLPTGTPITTLVDGVLYSKPTTVSNAAGAFAVQTAGNLLINSTTPEPSPTKYGANVGERFMYAASNFTTSVDVFQETSAWYPDLTVTQDLHLGSPATTPQPLKIQGIVTQPARGGSAYVLLCNPTTGSVSLSDYLLQRDAPGTYYGANLSLAGAVPADTVLQENLTSAFGLVPTGDALKLVYRNPGGAAPSASGGDIVVDRVEFNATVGGTLDWQPGSTALGSAPAPGPGQILKRSSSCADTNSPSDFQLATEPGLPSATPPVVTITAPTAGQNVQGGQVFTIRWTMTDDVFVNTYLKVWVNVTVRGNTVSLLTGTTGAVSVDWTVPDLDAPGSTVTVEAVDPFGAHGNATRAFNVTPATPYSAYVAILVIIVIAVFVLWAYRRAHRKAEAPQTPQGPPPPTTSPPAAAPNAGAAERPPAVGTKVCPQCHTTVQESDTSCFYCGHPFTRSP